MSLYNGKECVDDEKLLECVKHLQAAFPSVTMDFCVEIVRQCRLMEIPYEQLDDSVNWLIRHHHFPNITIADVLDYDVKIQLYTNQQVMKMDGKLDDDTRRRYKFIYAKEGVRFNVKLEDVLMLPDKFRDKLLNMIKQNEQCQQTN